MAIIDTSENMVTPTGEIRLSFMTLTMYGVPPADLDDEERFTNQINDIVEKHVKEIIKELPHLKVFLTQF